MIPLREIRRQIERKPFIDVRNQGGITLPETGWKASFALENVTFAYPSRPNVAALNNVSMQIEAGAVTAIVGFSGCGKSTTASLLLREFDPETANIPNASDPIPDNVDGMEDGQEIETIEKLQAPASDVEKAEIPTGGGAMVKGSGRICFAGRDVREYNLKWLRSQVAVVSQNPQLFSGTVFENVAAGLTGTDHEYRPDIDGAVDAPPEIKDRTAKIRELCSDAMHKAQAWQFVSKLPEGMDTMISGGRSDVLSGGQRQRLAIARALVRRPACMLLDEATSALDTDTEEKIRIMLEGELAERGMTTIIIAHRLSTVAKAGRIIVMKDGQVVDQGRYEELLQKDRPDQSFRQLAISQRAEVCHDTEAAEKQTDNSPSFSHTSAQLSTATSSATSTCSQLKTVGPEDVRDLEEAMSTGIDNNDRRRTLKRFFTLLGSQKWLLTIGLVSGLVAGASLPVSAYMLGQAIYALSDQFARPSVNTWSLWFLVMAFINLLIFL